MLKRLVTNSRQPGPLTLASVLLASLLMAGSASAQVDIEQLPDPTKPAPGAPQSSTPPEANSKENPHPAQSTPQARAKFLDELFGQLAKAPDPATAASIAEAIQRIWMFSDSDTTDLLMLRAQKAISEEKLDLALTMLDSVVELQPDFAEGWNRRAYVYFRMNDLERALGDIRRTLALEPKHFKALESMAVILRQTNSKKTALEALKKALELNPQAEEIKKAVEELSREFEGQGI